MQQQGSIVRWDSARGFGFIRCVSTQVDVFFHVRDFRGAPEPALHMAVEYQEIHVGGKGARAMAVRPCSAGPLAAGHLQHRSGSGQTHQGGSTGNTDNTHRNRNARAPSDHARNAPRAAHANRTARAVPAAAPATGSALLRMLFAGWLAMLVWGWWNGRLPLWSAGALLALNLWTVWAYAADKYAARAGTWRVSENQLHLMSLLGGWPAAWLAQQNLRHKTSQAAFRAVYWLNVALHCGVLALYLWLWRSPFKISF